MKEQLKSVKILATFENGKKEKHDFPIGGIVTGEKAYGVESDTGESIAAAIHNMRKSQEAFMQTKEQKEPQNFAIHGEKNHLIAFWEDLKKQGWETSEEESGLFNLNNHEYWLESDKWIINNEPYKDKIGGYLELIPVTTPPKYRNFTLPEQWKEALDFTNKQIQLYKELQKSKEQQLYEYFADNHDIQLLATDIQEIERIIKEHDLCKCKDRHTTSFVVNLCKKCKKYIY